MSKSTYELPRRFSVRRWLHFIASSRPQPHESIVVCGRARVDGDSLVLDSSQGSIWFMDFWKQNNKTESLNKIASQFLAINFKFSNYSKSSHVVEKIESYEVLNRIAAPNSSDEKSSTFNDKIAPNAIHSWAPFISQMRTILHDLGLMEVQTPTLVTNPGMEPELEPFKTEWKRGFNQSPKTAFLCTSPELHLKQLLAQDFTDIYEIKTVFRNEEKTDYHEPEFQMLEWYRAYATLDDIISDIKTIIKRLSALSGAVDLANTNIEITTVRDLIQKYTGQVLTPQTSKAELVSWLTAIGEKADANASWPDLFHHFWVSQVESQLPSGLLIVRDYPPALAALAEITSAGWGDRFEFYWDGIEIANAFQELTDEKEQRLRFEKDQKLRIQYGRTPLDIDENFMSALKSGLPPTAGIALGLDRLFQRLFQIKKIENTRAFSILWDFPF